MATTAQHGPAGLQVTSRDDDPYRVYVPRVLHHIPPEPTWWQTEGTLVFADVSGFTRLSERLARQGRIGAEELVTTISGVFTRLLSATRDGGDVLKFGGDALLILYTGEDHAARACHSAQGMQRALRDAGRIVSSHGRIRLRMSVGVHTGDFPFFLIGDRHLELVVTGPEATRTVRMESTADAGEILVSETTAAALPASAVGDRKPPGVLLRRISSMAPLAPPPMAAETSDLEPYIPILLRGRLGPESEEHEHRQVTVSFVHFAGVDDILRQRGPAEVFDRLQALAEVVERTTTELGVCILTTDIGPDGGKYYLAAGAPDAADDDEGRMLRACRRIVDADVGLQLRAGVNRGHVFGGDVGASFRRTYSVMGDPVNLAARIMGKADLGTVLAHRSVADNARAQFDTEAVAPFMVKGKTKPVDALLIQGVATPSEVSDPAAEPVPLVGRTAELEKLLTAARVALRGQGQVIDLVGEAGIGKSRLIREMVRQIADVQVVELACEPTDRLSAYSASRLLLRKALGIPLDAKEDDAGRFITDLIERSAAHLHPWSPLVATAAGASASDTEEVRQLAPQFRVARTRRAITDLIAAVLGPALIVIEDAFWMDDASADVLTGMMAAVATRPWLVVLSRRPRDSGLYPGLGFQADPLPLRPLDAADVDILTESMTEQSPVSPLRREELARRAGGNPLFLIELLRAEERGQHELPGSIEGVLAARIDSLDVEDRTTLRFVSVLGARFNRDVLDRSFGELGITGDHVACWQRLADFIDRDGDEFHFRHDLVREAAYEGLTFRRRRQLHARVAAAYGDMERADGRDHTALLALHFYRAGLYDRAYPYAVTAAERARDEYANALAAEFYRHALGASDHIGITEPERLSIAERLGDVLEVSGSYNESEAAYRRACASATTDHDRVRLMRKRGRLRERRGEVTNALRWYGRGLTASNRIDDVRARRALQGQLRVAYAVARFRQARFRPGLELCQLAARDAEAAGDRETLAYALYVSDATRIQLEPFCEPTNLWRALRLYEQLDDLLGQANVLDNLGVHAYYQGDWVTAVARYEKSREAALRAGDVVGAAVSETNIGEILSDQGRLRQAEDRLTQARSVLRGSGYAVAAALCDAYLGRTTVRLGRHREGLDLLEAAAAQLDEVGSDAGLEARIRTVEAFLALGEIDAATDRIQACLAAAAGDQNPALLSMALRLHGHVLHRNGAIEEAADALHRSLAVARETRIAYETAQTLRAISLLGFDIDGSAATESDQLFDQMGIGAA